MVLFATLVVTTLVGLAQVEQQGGGYFWELLTLGSPLLIGIQLTLINTIKE
jgi:hypothetical protein